MTSTAALQTLCQNLHRVQRSEPGEPVKLRSAGKSGGDQASCRIGGSGRDQDAIGELRR